MKNRTFMVAALTAVLFTAGAASAQTVANPVNVNFTPTGGSPAPGTTGAAFGTIQLVPSASGPASVVSLPLTLSTGGGAAVSNLSNCQVVNSNGTPLNTGTNAFNQMGSSNVLRFDQALSVTGTTTLMVRCNVASSSPSSGTFTFAIGTPTVAPALRVTLDVAPSVPAGSNDVTLANISLGSSASGDLIRVSSIPLTFSAGNGGSLGNLTNCRIEDAMNSGFALNTGVNALLNLGSGTNTFTLDNPLVIPMGSSRMLSVRCNVAAGASLGSTYTVAIDPAAVVATAAGTGARITPTIGTGTGPNGLPPSTSGTLVISGAGTSGNGTGGGTTPDIGGTPGVPNTGSGGSAPLALALLLLSGIAIGGGLYLGRATA